MTTTQYTRTGPKILYQQGDRVLVTYAPTSRYAGLPAQPATVVSQYSRTEEGVERVAIHRDGADYPEAWDTRYLQPTNSTLIGQRVQLGAHTDRWMMGDRYGEIIAVLHNERIRVLLDKSGKTLTFRADDLSYID